MIKKLFYITSEMDPFASVSPLSDLSVKVPLGLQEKGNDVRCLMPKYGFISERKYILREVIRLREILFDFDGVDYECSAKSAFLPKSRLQVYFLENEDIFGDSNNLLYKAKNGRFLNDNDKRFATYCLAAIKMLPNLFWYPNVIICSGWTSALIPMLVKILAKDDKDLAKIKTVYIASSLNEDIIFNPQHLGFNEGTFSPLKSLNLNQIGCLYADKTIIVNGAEKVSPKLKKLKVFKDAKNCSVVDLDYGDNTDYAPLLDAIELGIKKI